MISPQQQARGERLLALAERLKGVPARFDECSTMAAQWVADETGKEFDWPVYSSEDAMRAMLTDTGGLVALWERTARQIGLAEIINDMPQIGDVGIIVDNHEVPVGGIFLHGGVILWRHAIGTRQIGVYGRTYPVRTAAGIERRPLLLKAWRV